MKKLMVAGLLSLFVSVNVYAGPDDITTGVSETRPNITRWTIKMDKDLRFKRIWIVVWAMTDEELNVYKTKKVIFRDVADDPDTPEDETLTEYTAVKAAVDNGNKDAKLRSATIIKLGL